MSNALNLVIVGVGGQGTLLASRVLGSIASQLGLDVKVSEVHGMSQRGGSVTTYVRMGETVYSPLVEQGGADFILAFEELEALRALPYLKKGGALIVNTQQILPLPVITGTALYPAGIIERLKGECETVAVDALPLATKAGSARAVNTVLLGRLAKSLPHEKSLWRKALEETVPQRFLEANLRAFEAGFAL
ncbi:MAG: indolepyruvate oxidoreductase subunit beta [Christensenellaceae bacterium]|jgi:indolepyruvate ferredoxin oxidoreductase beta subunit|nr:indolepyruvate oxidoreductase subunit beta [Christensenellaceae bacterium]